MKQVVKTLDEGVRHIRDISEGRIYVGRYSSGFYKAHRVENKWAWIELRTSNCYANGTYDSFSEMIELSVARHPVYEFDTLKEFAEWLVKETE